MKSWDEIFEADPKYKPINEIFLSRLLEKVTQEGNPNPKKFVDLGCGMADTVIQFSQRGYSVLGIDVSKVALSKLQQKIAAAQAKNITLQLGDLNTLSEKIEADIFLCNFVYAFVQEKGHFLKYVSEMMSKDSVFIIITPVKFMNTNYIMADKPNIAVDYNETLEKLNQVFSHVEDYHHDYIAEREDYVTFFIKK